MLATRARGPEGVDAEILFIDLDVYIVLHDWIDEDRGKGRVTASLGVERRDTDQSVDAALGAQIAVGVAAPNLDGRRLDAGLVSGK